jgi:hypothetical protein
MGRDRADVGRLRHVVGEPREDVGEEVAEGEIAGPHGQHPGRVLRPRAALAGEIGALRLRPAKRPLQRLAAVALELAPGGQRLATALHPLAEFGHLAGAADHGEQGVAEQAAAGR